MVVACSEPATDVGERYPTIDTSLPTGRNSGFDQWRIGRAVAPKSPHVTLENRKPRFDPGWLHDGGVGHGGAALHPPSHPFRAQKRPHANPTTPPPPNSPKLDVTLL
jgi:hypothetical protein